MSSDDIGRTCPYCQAVIKPQDDVVKCGRCDVAHHKECWDGNDGCTTVSCKGIASRSGSLPSPRQEATSRRDGVLLLWQVTVASLLTTAALVGIIIWQAEIRNQLPEEAGESATNADRESPDVKPPPLRIPITPAMHAATRPTEVLYWLRRAAEEANSIGKGAPTTAAFMIAGCQNRAGDEEGARRIRSTLGDYLGPPFISLHAKKLLEMGDSDSARLCLRMAIDHPRTGAQTAKYLILGGSDLLVNLDQIDLLIRIRRDHGAGLLVLSDETIDAIVARGKVSGARRLCESLKDGFFRYLLLCNIALAQAKSNDLNGAKQTASLLPEKPTFGTSRDDCLWQIATIQVKAGDLAGATQTARQAKERPMLEAYEFYCAAAEHLAARGGGRVSPQKYLDQAKELLSEIERHSMLISIKVEPSVYLLLAWAFGKAGQSEKAGELLALARMVADMKDKLDKRKSAYQDIVETSCAIEQFGPACQIAEEIDSVSTRIRSYVCIAQAHLQRDQTDKARTFLSLAVEALRTVPEIMENKLLYREVTLTRLRAGYSPERAGVFPADSKMKDEVCREVAFHLVKRGDLGTAERFAEQMENADAVYDKLALAYARKGQIDKASALLRKLGHAFYGEATFLALGEAKARVNQAPALAQWVSGLPPGPARCYACIGIARKMLANAR